ncbi:MAG: YncE family protein, partial [Myxococcota bacterium]
PDAGDGGVDAGGADDAGTDAGTDAGGSDAGADGGGTPDGGTDGDPCEGRVYRIPLGPGGTMGEPETALVGPEAPLPDPVDLSALPDPFPPSADADAYEFECSPIDMTDVPDDVAPPDPTPGTAFRPVALTLDEERGHLLVSDEGLPLIHRIDASTSTVLAPIAVGVPTRAVAVTPEVPAAADAPEGAETARYLYAIDETDRSVLAVDYTEGAASFGAVLPVTDGRRTRDRVVLPADARFLEVVTPGYPGPMCTPGSEADEARNPSQFRGVFLVAGLADGTLRTVDIHDLDLTVSDGTGSDQGCLTCPTDAPGLDGDADRQWFLRRHSPRITELAGFTFRLRSEPRFRVDGVTHSVRPDGTTEEDEAPDLSPLEVGSPEDPCPDGMTPARMADVDEVDDALICLRADPWVTRSQQWQAEWEGTITPTLSGRLPDNAPILEVTEGALCARGVIGATDVSDPASDATLAGYPGDVAVITSSLPATTEGDPACEQFAGDDREDMEFRIADAQQTRLELDPLGDASLELVRQCFPGAVGFRVRTDDVYSVIGEVSGFRHSIEENVAAGDGSCVVAAGLDGGARGRATPGEVFTNAEVAFRTDDVPGADQSVLLEFDVTGGPDPSGLPLGTQSDGTRVPVLLSAGRFHPLNERLYVVDLANRGLVEMGLQPFRLLRTFE